MPAGNTGGGQWTSGGSGRPRVYITRTNPDDEIGEAGDGLGGGFGVDIGNVIGDVFGDIASEINKLDLFDTKPKKPRSGGIRLAEDNDRGGLSIDLAEEEHRGGHAISRHVNRTDDYLKSRVRDEAARKLDKGDYFEGFSVGSFTSLQAANRLVSSTLSRNRDKIEEVTRGGEPVAVARSKFASPTGYEAYLPRANAEPYMRDTFGVGVVIVRDRRSARGWRIQSAYPER